MRRRIAFAFLAWALAFGNIPLAQATETSDGLTHAESAVRMTECDEDLPETEQTWWFLYDDDPSERSDGDHASDDRLCTDESGEATDAKNPDTYSDVAGSDQDACYPEVEFVQYDDVASEEPPVPHDGLYETGDSDDSYHSERPESEDEAATDPNEAAGEADGTEACVSDGDLIVYARWIEEDSEPVVDTANVDEALSTESFEAQAKVATTQSDDTQTLAFDQNCADATGAMQDAVIGEDGTCVIPACAYERELFDFCGWNTMPDGSGVGWCEGETFTVGSATAFEENATTLYAQWSAKPLRVRVPVAIHYVAQPDGSVVGPTDDVVCLQNLGETCVRVDSAYVESVASKTLVREGAVAHDGDWSMGLRIGQGSRLDFYAMNASSDDARLAWMDAGESVYLNDLRGQVGSADLEDTYVGCLHWHIRAAKASER